MLTSQNHLHMQDFNASSNGTCIAILISRNCALKTTRLSLTKSGTIFCNTRELDHIVSWIGRSVADFLKESVSM